MEGAMMIGQTQPQAQTQQPPPSAGAVVAEKLNAAVVQQLNLESVRIRAVSLFKAISRIIDDFDAYGRTSTNPKWQDVLGQYSMVNMELFNIVEEVRKVSKAFLVHPKNVNADNSTVLPVMLSSKSLPEMESDDNSKREQLLHNMRHLPVANQIERLKARLDMIAAACESADKVLLETRKAYGFGIRQGPNIAPTLDKAQAAKIQEQESILRAAVNFGEGLRITGDQRQITPSLPFHLTDVLNVGDGVHGLVDTTGMYQKNIPMPSNLTSQGTLLQGPGTLHPRSAASPGATSFTNTTASPLPYANSPNSGTNMNAPSPQQQPQLQQQTQQQQQILQRQKIMQQLPQHQQLLAQQHLRQTAMTGLGQMQFPQQLGHQQFQGRQLASGHGIGQSQLNQTNQINRHLSQFAGTANNALFNAAQTTQSTQMMPNMAATMQSQNLAPRMQYGLSGTNAQRTHASQILNDQMFNMGGAASATGLMPMQQQQQAVSQGAFPTMVPNPQTLQPGMGTLRNNTSQGHPNFPQQRPPNQQ
ncbi:hypothetical protein MLD38_005562 [Melastoma candidum]|uniref:Uncharacterized protein n=1 Tax=Melastoma candidum TaxID=119954 RepID=A0ACB9RK53_9MYRT|nr:hypothetical protein MLD38_005562 [Melastoma candidum]